MPNVQYSGGRYVTPSDTVNNIRGARYLVNTGTGGVFYVRQYYGQVLNAATGESHPHPTQRNRFFTTGAGFTNQPANDGVEMVSSDAGDTTQTVTIYYTRNGGGDTVYSDTETLNGVTQVVFTDTDIVAVLGIVISAAHAGTVTVREASGNATIKAIATGTLSSGVYTIPVSGISASIPNIYAGGASTKIVGIVGTDSAGAALLDSNPLNGTTPVAMNSTFYTTTSLLVGDVATSTTVYMEGGAVLKCYLAQGASMECGASWLGVNSTSLGSGVELQALY